MSLELHRAGRKAKDARHLDAMLGRATSPELVDLAKAALLVIASRGGPEAEAASDVLEDADDSLRTLIGLFDA